MENPTFHLAGIVRSRDEMQDFEGPLDLILMLLSKNKIEIRDIQISELLEQYLAYLAQMQEMDLEIASSFVQMAAHLMYIKTRMLLAGDKEVTELEVLVGALEQLRRRDVYASVQAGAPALLEPLERGLRLHTRPPEPLPAGPKDYEYVHTVPELLAALAPMLLRGADRRDPQETIRAAAPRPIVYGVREKSRELLRLLRERGPTTLNALYTVCDGRSEVVATFLSVLELCVAGSLRVTAAEDGDFLVSAAAVTGGQKA